MQTFSRISTTDDKINKMRIKSKWWLAGKQNLFQINNLRLKQFFGLPLDSQNQVLSFKP